VVLMCVADANPAAKTVWKRGGRSEIVSLEETLQFRPVTRRNTGTYTCEAQNIVGSSEPLSVHIDVKCKYCSVHTHYSSRHQIACFKATKGLHPAARFRAARSQQYSVARFASLRVLSCLHSPGLRCSCCNVVRFCCDLEASNSVTTTVVIICQFFDMICFDKKKTNFTTYGFVQNFGTCLLDYLLLECRA
jgi:hypothetical protein